MLKSEVKETVDSLERDERVFLEAYLKVKNLVEDEDFRVSSGNRLAEMKAGKALSSNELKELDKALTEKGL